MRVSQLLEAIDFTPLVKIWQGGDLMSVTALLKQMGEDEPLLADIISKAKQKADAAPEKLFSLIEPIMDVQEHRTGSEYWHSYNSRVADLLNSLVGTVLKMDPQALKLLKSKVDLNSIANKIDRQLSVKLRLADWKITRTKKQEKFDKDNQLYVFIGRPGFKEEPGGKYSKTLEIEKLVPVDRFDDKAHHMVAMMKMRASFQGEKSEAYMVTLPKMAFDPHDELPDWLIALIDEHKKRITG